MIEEARGAIEYDECGSGPTVVLVPGSCSTGAAWRPIIAALGGGFRCVTTSLLGYGRTAERRTLADCSIAHEADMLESVIRRAGGRVHLAGHSFGGLVALAVALRQRVPLASLMIMEAPAPEVLREAGEQGHYRAFRTMTDAYFAACSTGNAEAIATMIDFYGGPGTFASWPPRVRAYAVETTPVNILDWASAYGFPLSPSLLPAVDVPSFVLWGEVSHPAIRRANELIAMGMRRTLCTAIAGAAHFMISTHPQQVAETVAAHVARAEAFIVGSKLNRANAGAARTNDRGARGSSVRAPG
jgi:pimeloyl-ACP methyl ester carboxylesterase